MSFDLTFWRVTQAPSADEALAVYERLMDGETGVVAPHPAVERFHRDVLARYGDLIGENADDSPWTCRIWVTEECVAVAIAWSRCAQAAPELREMASGHGLVTFDPQDGAVLM